MAVKVQAFRAQRATLQVVVVTTIHPRVNKPTNNKEIQMSKNIDNKSRPQYPDNKPSMEEFEKSGKGRSNKPTSK